MAGNKKSKVKKKKMMGGKKTKVMKLRGGMKTKVKKMAVGRTPPVKKTRRSGGGNMGIVGGRDYMPKPPKDLVRKPIRGQKVRPSKPKTRKDAMGRSMLAAGGVGKMRKGMKAGKVVSFQDYVKSMFGGGKT